MKLKPNEKYGPEQVENDVRLAETKLPPHRPFGSSNLCSKQLSGLARAFQKHGLDWRKLFAEAIIAWDKERIDFWRWMLPYLLTQNQGVRANKGFMGRTGKGGRPTKNLMATLKEMEERTDNV